MALTDTARRLTPFVQAAADDDQVRERLIAAAGQARAAVASARTRRQPDPSALKRAGRAVQEAGGALVALGQSSQKQQRRRDRAGRVRLGLPLAVATAAGAAALVSRRTSDTTTPTTGRTHG